MPKAKEQKKIDSTTEEKIKNAARIVFYKKGYAATRTRDIAEEAGLNLALLNYYFRSKEKLFEIIIIETLQNFIRGVLVILNDNKTTLEKKTEQIASRYIDFLSNEPHMPLFLMSEIRNNPTEIFKRLPAFQLISSSVLIKQYQHAVKKGKIAEPNPLHFMLNLFGLITFPFIASPVIKRLGSLQDNQFNQLMVERKKLIPVWIKAIMKAK